MIGNVSVDQPWTPNGSIWRIFVEHEISLGSGVRQEFESNNRQLGGSWLLDGGGRK